MHDRRNRGWWQRCGALALVFAAAACSTHTVTLRAVPGANLNPMRNKPDSSAALNLHVYFLKKKERFQPATKGVDAFLGDFGAEPKLPDFLGDDAVRVVHMCVSPTDPETVVTVEEVPKEAAEVGIVAFFQWHDENDADEVWWDVLPVSGATVSFRVAGRRIERIVDESAPAAPPPSSAAEPSDPKEAPRGTRRNR